MQIFILMKDKIRLEMHFLQKMRVNAENCDKSQSAAENIKHSFRIPICMNTF